MLWDRHGHVSASSTTVTASASALGLAAARVVAVGCDVVCPKVYIGEGAVAVTREAYNAIGVKVAVEVFLVVGALEDEVEERGEEGEPRHSTDNSTNDRASVRRGGGRVVMVGRRADGGGGDYGGSYDGSELGAIGIGPADCVLGQTIECMRWYVHDRARLCACGCALRRGSGRGCGNGGGDRVGGA